MMGTLIHGMSITHVVGNIYYLMIALIVFDVVTGLLASAKERKLNSSINFNGFLKKIGELIALAFISLVDAYFQTHGTLTKTGASMLIIYEGLSVIENLSRVGVNLSFLTKFFDSNKVGGK